MSLEGETGIGVREEETFRTNETVVFYLSSQIGGANGYKLETNASSCKVRGF